MKPVIWAGLGLAALLALSGCGEPEATVNANEVPGDENVAEDIVDGGDLGTHDAETEESTEDLTEEPEGMTILDSRNWASWINLMPGSEPRLYVTGEVQLGAAGQIVSLVRKEPQGINPAILMLEVEIEEQIGAQVLTWYDLRWEEPAEKDQFTEVNILYNGEMLERIEVTEAH